MESELSGETFFEKICRNSAFNGASADEDYEIMTQKKKKKRVNQKKSKEGQFTYPNTNNCHVQRGSLE